MSLLSSLNVGMKGLHAAQVAIDVTGQNISNANTEGYSRKRVDLKADSISHDVYGQVGVGVEVTAITRVRNEFLDRQTWEQMGDMGLLRRDGQGHDCASRTSSRSPPTTAWPP